MGWFNEKKAEANRMADRYDKARAADNARREAQKAAQRQARRDAAKKK